MKGPPAVTVLTGELDLHASRSLTATAELIDLTHVDGQRSVHATHEQAQAALAEGAQGRGPTPAADVVLTLLLKAGWLWNPHGEHVTVVAYPARP